jgi:hypothetical protein
MDDLNAAGMAGPVIISLGNDYHLHYERRIAEVFGIPLVRGPEVGGKSMWGPEVSPELDKLFVSGLRQIKAHWLDKGWPQELVLLIYDEPTERLLDRAKNRYDLLKTALPETRVYGVVMNRREWAESMLDQMDIIVANGDFDAMKKLAVEYDKDYWVYGGIRGVAQARFNKGFLPWKVGAAGVFTWMYNYFDYSLDGCMVMPDPANPEKFLRSVYWEAVREGADDLRYVATAGRLAAASSSSVGRSAANKLARVKADIELKGWRTSELTPNVLDKPEMVACYNSTQDVRTRLIEIILSLLNER